MKFVNRLLTGLLFLAIVVGTIAFAISNTTPVEVDFLALKLTANSATWIIGAFVLGGFCGLLAGTGMFVRLKANQLRTARKVKQFEQEISQIQAKS